ncbi:MAG: hypothetical protein PVH61_20255 [Candidatus Aminicenantes bacterium]|jgi:hypothetical protein
MIGQNRPPVTKRAPGPGTVQFTSYWPRPAPAILRAMYEEIRAKSDENEQKRRCQAKIFSIFLIILFTAL